MKRLHLSLTEPGPIASGLTALAVTGLFLGGLTLRAAPARAASPIAEVLCAPSEQMVQRLRNSHGADRRATGIRSPDEVVEVWTDARGDWTMVISYASGKSCIVAMGEHWSERAPVEEVRG